MMRQALHRRGSVWRPGLAARAAAGLLLVAVHAAQAAGNSFDCVIEPQQTVKLSSAVAGVIAEVLVDRGDFVRKGQVVARLEAGAEEASLALAQAKASDDYAIKSAQAKLEFLRRKHERSQELVGRRIVAEATFDEDLANARMAEQDLRGAELAAHVAKLEVEQAAAILAQRILRSPIDGVVVEVTLHPGEYRNDQSPIMTLAQIDPLRVEAFIPTAHFGRILVGGKALVEPEAPIGGTFSARVDVVDRVIDAGSGMFGVRLELPNPDHRLPGGLKCTVAFPETAASRTGSDKE
jgi:RND family efflux transporter MFP subunit